MPWSGPGCELPSADTPRSRWPTPRSSSCAPSRSPGCGACRAHSPGMAVASVLAVTLASTWVEFRPALRMVPLRRLLGIGIPITASMFLATSLYTADRWVVAALGGATLLGYYAFAASLADITGSFAWVVRTVVFADVYGHAQSSGAAAAIDRHVDRSVASLRPALSATPGRARLCARDGRLARGATVSPGHRSRSCIPDERRSGGTRRTRRGWCGRRGASSEPAVSFGGRAGGQSFVIGHGRPPRAWARDSRGGGVDRPTPVCDGGAVARRTRGATGRRRRPAYPGPGPGRLVYPVGDRDRLGRSGP